MTALGLDLSIIKETMSKQSVAIMGIGHGYKEALILGVESKFTMKAEQIPNNNVDLWFKAK